MLKEVYTEEGFERRLDADIRRAGWKEELLKDLELEIN
jgi:hypothetical protein